MSDAMSDKDPKCQGCIHWNCSYNEKPCSECNKMFSGYPNNYFETGILATASEFLQILPGKTIFAGTKDSLKGKDRAKQLAEEHWKYIEGVLNTHLIVKDKVDIAKYHYLTAFQHGYKHCWEDFTENN